jgi:uncharacterized protein YacL
MAWFVLARVLIVAAVAYSAALLQPLPVGLIANIAFAVVLAGLVVAFETRLRDTAPTRVLGALLGCAIGLTIARAIEAGLFFANSADRKVEFLHAFLLIVLPYLGLVLGAKNGEWLEPARLLALFRATGPQRRYKILDTSVIIDGRIADVCEHRIHRRRAGHSPVRVEGTPARRRLGDSLKRNRGRRGLDILQKIQKMSGVEVIISDVDFPEVRRSTSSSIELARTLQGKIVTNDFNLNKVASCAASKCSTSTSSRTRSSRSCCRRDHEGVHLKEGKEYNQGVAYLDDGTMVVVDNARKMISKTIDIVVTSVLQTTAGKMIFGRYIEPAWPPRRSRPARCPIGRGRQVLPLRAFRRRRRRRGCSADIIRFDSVRRILPFTGGGRSFT